MEFEKLNIENETKVGEMSAFATIIIKDYYDYIVGATQNDYMLEKFQSVNAIYDQLKNGYNYYFVKVDNKNVGFLAFYPRDNSMYISKFYLEYRARNKGYSRQMLNFVTEKAKDSGLNSIELNVNKQNPSIAVYEKLGFKRLRAEKIDIGAGYFMDDYVYKLTF